MLLLLETIQTYGEINFEMNLGPSPLLLSKEHGLAWVSLDSYYHSRAALEGAAVRLGTFPGSAVAAPWHLSCVPCLFFERIKFKMVPSFEGKT